LRHTGLLPGQLPCSQPGQETGWLRQYRKLPQLPGRYSAFESQPDPKLT